MTERYAHLRIDLFGQRDLATIPTDLRAGGKVEEIGCRVVTDEDELLSGDG